jgi:hypothetical protein
MSLLGEHSSGQSAQVNNTTHVIPEEAGVGWGIAPFEQESSAQPEQTEQVEQPQPTQQQPTQQQPTQQTNLNAVETAINSTLGAETEVTIPPELQQKYADLDEYLKATTGHGLSEVAEVLTSFDTLRQEIEIQRQVSALQKEWGNEYDARYAKVVEIFKALPPSEQAHYDSVRGAMDLWDRYELAQLRTNQRLNSARGAVPRSTNTVPPSDARAYDYTAQEIENLARLNPAEYDKQKDRITQAYLTGRVRR